MSRLQTDKPAEVIAEAVPALVDELAMLGPGRVYREAVALVERPLLERALALTGGNQLRAARLLGLNRNTLRKRCRELGLAPTGVAEVSPGLK
jgi:two-component system nitrogen regulation response regulator GlnG